MKATQWVLGALLTVMLIASTAAADATLEIQDLGPEIEMPLQEGDAITLAFRVALEAEGFGCVQNSEFPISLQVMGSPPPGTTVSVEPEVVGISVATGLYADPPLSAFSGSGNGEIRVSSESIGANASFPLTLVATYGGGAPDNCEALPVASIPALEATGDTIIHLQAPEPEPEPEPEPDERGLPAPGLLAILGGVGAAVALQRRRAR